MKVTCNPKFNALGFEVNLFILVKIILPIYYKSQKLKFLVDCDF